MAVHIVGSGIASLAAAVYLVQDANVTPGDIVIYEPGRKVGGAMFMEKVHVPPVGHRPTEVYVLPATRILEREYQCALELFSRFHSVSIAKKSIKQDVRSFNAKHPYHDKSRLLDKSGKVLSSEYLGISLIDRIKAVRFLFKKEDDLDGLSIDSFFTPDFYKSEFFLAWSTMMGPLRQHSAIEFQRYFKRFLHIVPCVDTMEDVWRMRLNQDEGVAEPILKWLIGKGVQVQYKTTVEDVTFEQIGKQFRAKTITLSTASTPIDVTNDHVFITLGSQTANLAVGSMGKAPQRAANPKEAWDLWTRITRNAQHIGRDDFGDPAAFFKPDDLLSTWVTFTVTATDRRFLDRLQALTKVPSLQQGLVTLVDSPWLITVAPFPKRHFVGQTDEVWWGFSLCHDKDERPDRDGEYVAKPITKCSGSEILTETIRQFGFDSDEAHILDTSVCMPCYLPHAGSVWLTRKKKNRPQVVPNGAKNFAFLGQFCEMELDTMFTMEYSVRSAREAVSILFNKPKIKPPPVYQGQDHWDAVTAVLKRYGLGTLARICP